MKDMNLAMLIVSWKDDCLIKACLAIEKMVRSMLGILKQSLLYNLLPVWEVTRSLKSLQAW